jgi:ferric-dicitrate binding protein FerR (iron transport regulator)
MTPIDPTPEPIRDIITRFLEGDASGDEVAILQAWLEENKTNRQYFDEVNNAFQVSVTLSRFNQQKIDTAWNALAQRMDQEKKRGRIFSFFTIPHFSALRIAASVFLVAVSCYLIVPLLSKDAMTSKNATLVRNAEGSNTRILLPDGSLVWLNTNSTLEYPPSFGNSSRIVTLKGEAFFDVTKGRTPFIVQTERLQVLVMGTRFNVQAYKNDPDLKTTLEEGKIELRIKGEDQSYLMKPGDQITLNTGINKITLKKVNPANFTAWKEDVLVFDNTELGEIAAKLENRFKVKLSVDSTLARRERLTMTLEHESLEEVLELIRLSSHLKIKTKDHEIILYE